MTGCRSGAGTKGTTYIFLLTHDESRRGLEVLLFFASVGVQPLVDDLCDRSRTRVLQFPIPSDQDAIVRRCRRVFTEVYSMRRGDGLNYHFLRKSDVGS